MEGTVDTSTLDRFLPRQAETHAHALAEIAAGHKETHWIWWELPQLRGLGRSQRAHDYGLADLEEASRYLAHPVLGPRLIALSKALLRHKDTRPEEILGRVDAVKVRSCMTLFALVPNAPPVFEEVLAELYREVPCPYTIKAIA